MYPYIHLGPLTLGTFGLLLWLGAVAATIAMHKNFQRFGVDADALNVVAFVTIAGVLGAKTWHELQDVNELRDSLRQIFLPGWHHPVDCLVYLLHWFQAGFAWFGGLTAGILMLLWQGQKARFKGPLEGTQGMRVGSLRMLDLAAPVAAVGYAIGRIGCLTSGDGDYGVRTTLPWGVHIRNDALAPPVPNPPDLLVHPTPVYEMIFGLLLGFLLWKLAKKQRPVGWLTGLYLLVSGVGRFLVEFIRINPKIHWGMSNAQCAALGTVLIGGVMMAIASARNVQWMPELADDPAMD